MAFTNDYKKHNRKSYLPAAKQLLVELTHNLTIIDHCTLSHRSFRTYPSWTKLHSEITLKK